MNPHQAEEVAALAQDTPGQCFIVNHCCTPNDRDAEGMARWRAGLLAMGRCHNIAIKLSNYAAYAPDRSLAADRDTLRTCIDAFGPRPLPVRQRLPGGAADHDLCRAVRPLPRGRRRIHLGRAGRRCSTTPPPACIGIGPMTPEPLAFIGTSDLAGLVRGKSVPLAELPGRMGRGVGITPQQPAAVGVRADLRHAVRHGGGPDAGARPGRALHHPHARRAGHHPVPR